MKLSSLTNPTEGEKIIFLLRRHPIIFLVSAFKFVILLVVPAIVYNIFPDIVNYWLSGEIARPVIILGISAYYLLIWLFLMTAFVDYYLDMWVVTNDKIINVEQNGLFNRTISELDLAKIQDVTSDVRGIFASIFRYGNLHIQTAGEIERFVFEQIPSPHNVRRHLLELAELDLKEQYKDG